MDFELPPIVSSSTDESKDTLNGNLKRNRVLYLNALYTIDMLRLAEPTNVNIVSTYLYGVANNAEWINKENTTAPGHIFNRGSMPPEVDYKSQELMRQFMYNNSDMIARYHVVKFNNVVKKLLKWTEELENHLEFLRTPLEPNIVNSIVNELDTFANESTTRPYVPYWSKSRHRTSSNDSLSVSERLLRGVFDIYGPEHMDLKTDQNIEKYGAQRVEILSDKVYLCCKKIRKLIDRIEYSDSLGLSSIRENDYIPNYKSIADVLSILFRLHMPRGIHPISLSKMYNRFLMQHNEDYPAALSQVRKYSDYPIEAVLDVQLPELPCNCKIGELLDPKLTTGRMQFRSLVEEYLVTQWFADKL